MVVHLNAYHFHEITYYFILFHICWPHATTHPVLPHLCKRLKHAKKDNGEPCYRKIDDLLLISGEKEKSLPILVLYFLHGLGWKKCKKNPITLLTLDAVKCLQMDTFLLFYREIFVSNVIVYFRKNCNIISYGTVYHLSMMDFMSF